MHAIYMGHNTVHACMLVNNAHAELAKLNTYIRSIYLHKKLFHMLFKNFNVHACMLKRCTL